MRRRYFINVTTNWLKTGLRVVLGIVVVPIFLQYLGLTNYGIWILINSVVGYYGLLDLGVHGAAVRYGAKFLALDDKQAFNENLNTAFLTHLVLAALALGATAIIAVVIPHLTGFAASEHPQAATLFFLVGASMAVTFPGNILRGLLNAAERYDLVNAILIASFLLLTLGQVAALMAGGGLVSMAWVLLVVNIAEKTVTGIVALRTVRIARLAPRYFRWKRVREILVYGFHFTVFNAGERLRFFTGAIVIGSYLPASAITIFNIGTRPAQYVNRVAEGVAGVLTPAFSKKEAAGTVDQMRRLLLLANRATAVVCTLLCLLLAVSGDRLIRLWVGSGFEESFAILLLLLPAYLIETGMAPTKNVFLGTDHYKVVSRLAVVEGLANLGLSLLLIRPLGLIGVALGTVIPMVLMRLLVLPVLACRIVEMSLLQFFRQIWAPVVPAALVTGLVSLVLVRWIPGQDIVSVIAIIGILAVCYCTLTFLTMGILQDELLPEKVRRWFAAGRSRVPTK